MQYTPIHPADYLDYIHRLNWMTDVVQENSFIDYNAALSETFRLHSYILKDSFNTILTSTRASPKRSLSSTFLTKLSHANLHFAIRPSVRPTQQPYFDRRNDIL